MSGQGREHRSTGADVVIGPAPARARGGSRIPLRITLVALLGAGAR